MEELEPGPCWPHAAILGDLTKNPTVTAPELGATIVERYVESYRHDPEDATQSAIHLDQLGEGVDAVDLLAQLLLPGLKSPALRAALETAWQRTLRLFGSLYVDLHHFADNLGRAASPGRIVDACRDIERVIEGHDGRSPIIAEGHLGQRMASARGLSIYFPAYRDLSAEYQAIDFAQRTAWGEFLAAYLDKERRGRLDERSHALAWTAPRSAGESHGLGRLRCIGRSNGT